MFWGLMLKANRKYSQTIQKPFHLSQAALDIKSSTDGSPVQVLLTTKKSTYVICTLRLNTAEQVALDLNFQKGDEIAFSSQGGGNIHLTGYLLNMDEFDDDESDLDMENVGEGLDQLHKQLKAQNKVSKKNKKEADSSDDEDDEDDDGAELDDSADADSAEEELEDSDEDADETDDSEEEEVQEPKAKQQKLDKPKENGVGKQQQQANKKGKKDQSAGDKPKAVEKNLQGGVKVEDLKIGAGNEAKSGKKVHVYYVGRLKSNNKIFDSATSGAGFKFSLGRGEVIKAWDIGIAGMKVGGKRKIICPPSVAYGAKGSPPVIPPNSTLVFEVELKNVN